MPIGDPEVRVGVPAVTNKLDTGDLALLVRVLQRFIKDQVVAFNSLDPPNLQLAHLIHADPDQGTNMEGLGTAQANLGGTGSRVSRQGFILWFTETLAIARVEHGEGAHRLFIGHAGDNPIRCLRVELHKVNVHVDLTRIEVLIEIGNLIGKDDIGGIAHVHAQHQRNLQVIIGPNLFLLIVVHVDLSVLIHDRCQRPLAVAFFLGKGNRQLDRVDVEVLHLTLISLLRTQAPGTILTRLGHLGALGSVRIAADRLQEGGRVMVRTERRSFTKMGLHQRPGNFTGLQVKENRGTLAGLLRQVLGPLDCRFWLTQIYHVAALTLLLGPIPDTGVISLGLAGFIILLAGLALGRKLHFNPILK